MSTTLQDVLTETTPVTERFAEAGFALYLVGGIVRDIQLGYSLDQLDFDLTTDAHPADIKRLVGPIADAVWDQGERFGTIGCRVNGRPFEITTHRADWYVRDSRKPAVEFGDDIVVDLSRRDFTVNAMAISVFDQQLVDPFNGRSALRDKELRTPIDAHLSFADDPLRIMRAARFIARYGLEPTESVRTAASELVDRLQIVSAERIRDELDKLLDSDAPSTGLEFLSDVGALAVAIPFLTEAAVDELAPLIDHAPVDNDLRRVLLYSMCPEPDRREWLRHLRYSNEEIRSISSVLAGLDVVGAHVEPRWSDEDVRRLVDGVGFERMDLLWDAGRARYPNESAAGQAAHQELGEREDLSSFAPAIGGDELMQALGLSSGPSVGEALSKLRERRLRDGPVSIEEEIGFLGD